MTELTTKLAEALRLISFASMDRGARDTATEALRLYDEVERLSAPLAPTPAPVEPVAWGMRDKTTGLILDVICPDEHESFEGDYTVPLFAAPVAATPAPALYVGLIERLMRLSTRLGIAHECGVEHFAAGLEDRLYAICRSAEGLLDSMAATPAPARCANGPMGCDYPRCDCNGASTNESNK